MQVTIEVPEQFAQIPLERQEQAKRKAKGLLEEEINIVHADKVSDSDDPWSNPDAPFPIVDTGIEDLAENHDHYLYGTPKHS